MLNFCFINCCYDWRCACGQTWFHTLGAVIGQKSSADKYLKEELEMGRGGASANANSGNHKGGLASHDEEQRQPRKSETALFEHCAQHPQGQVVARGSHTAPQPHGAVAVAVPIDQHAPVPSAPPSLPPKK